MTDERVEAVRKELASGAVSPQSLVLLFNAASDAEHARDTAALEDILAVAGQTARTADQALRADAERLLEMCEQSLLRARAPGGASGGPQAGAASVCPDCGNEVPSSALRCRRCGHRFI
jgi:hypothetical protein